MYLWAFLLVPACFWVSNDDWANATDRDGDGYTDVAFGGEDCDDASFLVHPGAPETCNGWDDDCDGRIDADDPDAASTWYADGDGDGYGDPENGQVTCDPPPGHVANREDCDDGDAARHPGATWYPDADGDGFGALAGGLPSCEPAPGYVADSTDCDDTDYTAYPGAFELCNAEDDDCDGYSDETPQQVTWYQDNDGDDWGSASVTLVDCAAPEGYAFRSGDCDDTVAAIHPGAPETCSGADDDCDGLTDAEDPDMAGNAAWYLDADGDGHGSDDAVEMCSAPEGRVRDGDDCDDANAAIWPGAPETCDGLDNDCDGLVDGDDPEDGDYLPWFADTDADGYGDDADVARSCTAPAGRVGTGGDCAPDDASAWPGALETPGDGIDQDCDGGDLCYADSDLDGFGSAATTPSTDLDCDDSSEAVSATDCDDLSPGVSPGAAERCNGIDDDCDGSTDEDDAVDAPTWYADRDGDTFGDAATPRAACAVPDGFTGVGSAFDCDDARPSVRPAASEIPGDGVDQDCDGGDLCYVDADGDGFGSAATAPSADLGCTDGGESADPTDCDDTRDSVSPAGTETCDGVDDDCDGVTDEDDAVDAPTWYADRDGDTFGDTATPRAACAAPEGYSADPSDCDHARAFVNPTAPETCGGGDEDCDGLVDEDDATDAATWYADADADGWGDPLSSLRDCDAPPGYVANAMDCDDALATVHPSAPEDCGTSYDDDCDGATDDPDALGCLTRWRDADGDGFGGLDASVCLCEATTDYPASSGDDCDDADATVYPGASEVCDDGVLNDCEGDEDGVRRACWEAMDLSSPFALLHGEDANDHAGEVVAGGNDNGDAYDDILLLSRYGAYLVRGPVSGPVDLADANAHIVHPTETGYQFVGLDFAGDMDGDGFDEIIAGNQDIGTNGYGQAYLFHGPVTGWYELADADRTISAAPGMGALGYEVSHAGDVNDDGLADVIVAAPYAGGGSALVFLGPVTASGSYWIYDGAVRGSESGSCTGIGISAAGDTDGDGFDDVLVPSFYSNTYGLGSGQIFLFLGPVTGDLTDAEADATYYGQNPGDNAGGHTSGVGDTNGDGYDDVIIGAIGVDAGGPEAGAVYLALGPLVGTQSLGRLDTRLLGDEDGALAGSSGEGAGDLDGDGLDDILIGAWGANTAYLLFSPVTGTADLGTVGVKFEGGSIGLGQSVARAGDVDGDSLPDVLFGASYTDYDATDDGAVYLLAGPGF